MKLRLIVKAMLARGRWGNISKSIKGELWAVSVLTVYEGDPTRCGGLWQKFQVAKVVGSVVTVG